MTRDGHHQWRFELSRFLARVASLAIMVTGSPAAAQGLPPLSPLNPVVEMRSGLATLPWLASERTWHFQVTTDYGSLAEYTSTPSTDFVLDAELLSTRVLVARSIGSQGFVLAGVSWNLASEGRLDDLMDAYHEIFGVRVLGRERRPENTFAYIIDFDGGDLEYGEAAGFLGDLRVGAGIRHHRHWQSVFTVTIPTGSGPAGYRKIVPSANLTTTLHREFGAEGRFAYEGTFGVGYTPRNGALSEWQRTTFGLLTQGARARLLGPWHAYVNFVLASPYYGDSGIPELDANELALDLGTMFHFAGGPTCFLAMTQDLIPNGPAVDVVFRFGAYW